MKWKFIRTHSRESKFAKQEIALLKEHVVAAKNFIVENREYFKGKTKLPMYLILGPERFGKSTLLSKSGLNLRDINHREFNHVVSTKYCSFWFSQDALYLDIAGNYAKPDGATQRNSIIWQGFINLLLKYFGEATIAGIITVLDLPALYQDNTLLNETLTHLRERIYEMASVVKSIKIYLVFTKCDYILGFREFFHSLDAETIQSPLGISFSNGKHGNLTIELEDKFKELLVRLNARVIEFIQNTTLATPSKSLIKLFPSALAQCQRLLIKVINRIPHGHHIVHEGIYFTSSMQGNVTINPLQPSYRNILSPHHGTQNGTEIYTKHSYFIEGLFKDVFRQKNPTEATKKVSIPSLHSILILTPLALTIATLLLGLVLSHHSYHRNLVLLDRLVPRLQNNPIPLPRTEEKLRREINSWLLKFGTNRIAKLCEQLEDHSQKIALKENLNGMENYLTQLCSNQNYDGKKLYYTLQTYLMLTDNKRFNAQQIKYWFDHYGKDKTNNIDLKTLLRSGKTNFALECNANLVATARSKLQSLPIHQRHYLAFEGTSKKNDFKHGIIANLYLKENFHSVYQRTIPKLAAQFFRGDWVMGAIDSIDIAIDDHISKLRHYYVESYVGESKYMLLNSGQQILADDFPKLLALFRQEASHGAIFAQTIKAIERNLEISNPPVALAQEIDNQIGELSKINLDEIKKILAATLVYFEKIAAKKNWEEKFYIAIVESLQNINIDNPLATLYQFAIKQNEPTKSYLLAMVQNSWEIITKSSYHYIRSQWQKEVLPAYHGKLENRYPFSKASEREVSLKDFNSFFAPHGIMDRFFTRYIEPLVTIDRINWQWQKIAGEKIKYPSEMLEFFLRAALIQKMFYPQKTPTPLVTFDMAPMAMTPHTQSFVLHLNGQQVSYSNGMAKQKQTISWPGTSNAVTLSFTDDHGKYISTTEIGDWAWFKILDKSVLDISKGSKKIELTLELHGNVIKYLLTATNVINIFMLEIIDNFKLY